MNRLEKKFVELKKLERKAFIAYITAGDPSLDSTVRLVREFEKQGVDCIELGVPFSDPIADGPVNQEAAMRALRNPIGIRQILDAVREIRKDSEIPIIFFAYYNSILSYGLEQFVLEAEKSGLDGALILDLPPEEAGKYKLLMDAKGLSTVFLVSPVTPDERLKLISQYATGFIYYVSQMGVTGERDRIGESIPDMVARIRKMTDTPVAVGFGISRPEHVIEIARYADGVIVGSSIVRRIGENGDKSGFEKEVGQFVGTLTKPLGKAG
ncbi:MAG: tryptophan synthase subunit alpha [Candidatus Latescibacterota bacterium]